MRSGSDGCVMKEILLEKYGGDVMRSGADGYSIGV